MHWLLGLVLHVSVLHVILIELPRILLIHTVRIDRHLVGRDLIPVWVELIALVRLVVHEN